MKVYIVTDADLENLRLRLKAIPSNNTLNSAEKTVFEGVYRSFNYHIESWVQDTVTSNGPPPARFDSRHWKIDE